MKIKGIKYDFWYGHTLKDVAAIDCTFYDNDAIYRGNMYDSAGRMIGDFSSHDSVLIEEKFPGIFG